MAARMFAPVQKHDGAVDPGGVHGVEHFVKVYRLEQEDPLVQPRLPRILVMAY